MDDELIKQLENLISYTKKNKIPWKFLNEQTFRWTKQETLKSNQLITTIQYAGKQQRATLNDLSELFDYYILTIQSTNPSELLLQITSNEKIYQEKLNDLFNAARNASKVTTANVLKNLLDNIY
ncbi:hypothetical protein LPTSP3_g31070 [Leptospira kobayashii]|uniref:Uncharacterized protein n=1 Tax=Leptospira kobayashii TaxID=1917830 RepID=A0ABN6KJA3_9LEPT|nr:hypothetical protein [Leptospira kobayashii]BDA80177.1 hypothetical protein LPTSP3_g31070 [Leptospira kobayashii]